MTMFRVGPAGIPASLKTDMNSVLNKKFGTTGQNYPPNGWPADVNLMGPLPEGTATGPIASISDGADRVPIKSWNVNIDPNLTGKSAIVATQGGKNLLAKEIVRYTNAMADLSECFAIHHGTYTVTIGTVENATNWRLSVFLMDSNGNTLTDNAYKPSNDLQLATNRWRYGSNTTTKSFTVNIVVDCYVRFFIELGDTSSSTTISNSFLDVGSASTSYSPYTAPTVSTVNLGQTINGGSADVVNGTGTGLYRLITFDGSQAVLSDNYGTGGYVQYSCATLEIDPDIDKPLYDLQPGLYVDALTGNYRINTFESGGIKRIRFNDIRLGDTITSKDEWNANLSQNPVTIAYPLATPIDFTFDPITPTPQTPESHSANFWADTGDSTVVYRRDIDLALQAVSGTRNLLMMASRPIAQLVGEESDPDQVNELVEDDEMREGETK